ncbi:MAG: 23S rRNA (adenine(2030)-N(6))-methyltransferase RlmJ [Halioglobus sp.]|nr:23S rRNA (adenine(2030)-N(6))-methyltransferase RlmJ [Halioglobus sp.]
MLSYRHAFHAGNHADVLKHLAEVLILQYLVQKEGKPLRYIDTHSGPGTYALRASFSSKNREFKSGIARLWDRGDLPSPVQHYVDVVRSFNASSELLFYPGSPAIASAILGAAHRLQFFELHPADASILGGWVGRDRRIKVAQADGFLALKAILPPPERRAFVMIDPPYEVKTDYDRAISALENSCKKFATGVYALWYPLLDRDDVSGFVKKLKAMPVKSLLVEFPVQSLTGDGMRGSGLFIVNPPWILHKQLEDCLPYLHTALAESGASPWSIRSHRE